MYQRCFALLLALSLILGYAPLHLDARAQANSSDKSKTQDQTGTKQNAPAGQKQQPAPTEKQVEKIMHAVFKVGVGQRMTVFLKSGDTLHGTLAEVREDDFQLAEVDRRQNLAVRYDEVKKVREGFGGINLFTGQRTSHSRGTRIAVTVAAFAGVLLLPIILVAASKD